ncbi:MAG TPA: 4-hydroxy-tetrahydrodipicolinate synthase [Candidatus Acidoferrum sp.]|nr:4-hydroxy-tetrahydrodipicolinate synthase [Candidatus Acidoferrum sp.]
MIEGSIVALVTPMATEGGVDYPRLAALVEWHVASGTNAIVAVGTTGESATLSVEEHCEVIKRTVKTSAGRIPVIAGTGANSTTEAIELTQAAKDAGADACLLVTPYYNKPSQRGLIAHHTKIAESVAIPQILYNVPGRTACDMLPDTIAALAQVPNIIGVKEATGNLDRGREVLARCPAGFAVYSGDDATFLELMLMGARGNISVTANVAPAQMAKVCRLLLQAGQADGAGREALVAQARAINAGIAALHQDLFLESNPVPVKWALAQMGKMSGTLRLPLVELDAKFHDRLRATLKSTGVL